MSEEAAAVAKRVVQKRKGPAAKTAGRRTRGTGSAGRRPKAVPMSAPRAAGPAASAPDVWIAQYVYAGPGGETRLAVRRICARGRDNARAVALKAAPGEEFLLTVVPESDDQFLGLVRLRALAARDGRAG